MSDAWADLALSWMPGEEHIYFILHSGNALRTGNALLSDGTTRRQAFSDALYRQLRDDFAACVRQPADPQPFYLLSGRLCELVPDDVRAELLTLAREPHPAVLRLTLTPALQNLPWECTPLDVGSLFENTTWGTVLRAVRYTGSTPALGGRELYYLFYDEALSDNPCPPAVPHNPPPQIESLYTTDDHAQRARLHAAMGSAGVLHLLAHGVKDEQNGHTCTQILRGAGEGAFISAGDIRDGALFAGLRAPAVLADCCSSAWQDPRGGPSLLTRTMANGRAKLFVGNLDEALPGEAGSRFFSVFTARLYGGAGLAECLAAARQCGPQEQVGIMNYIAACHIAGGISPTDTLNVLLGIRRLGLARRRPALWKLPVCAAVSTASVFAASAVAAVLTGRGIPPLAALLLGIGLGLLAGVGLLLYDFLLGGEEP